MKKVIFAVLVLFQVCIASNSYGLKLQLVVPDIYQTSIGFNGFALVEINKLVYFYPNLDFWFSSDHHYYYYDKHNYYYSYVDRSVRVMAFNVDFAIMLPGRSVRPYFGLGLAPVIGWGNWYYDEHYSEVEAAMNLFCGIKLPLGRQRLFFELRGQFANQFSSFKMCFGISF
jgi:hypothetical protein